MKEKYSPNAQDTYQLVSYNATGVAEALPEGVAIETGADLASLLNGLGGDDTVTVVILPAKCWSTAENMVVLNEEFTQVAGTSISARSANQNQSISPRIMFDLLYVLGLSTGKKEYSSIESVGSLLGLGHDAVRTVRGKKKYCARGQIYRPERWPRGFNVSRYFELLYDITTELEAFDALEITRKHLYENRVNINSIEAVFAVVDASSLKDRHDKSHCIEWWEMLERELELHFGWSDGDPVPERAQPSFTAFPGLTCA